MKLIEVICNTDWKCRPTHQIKVLAEGTKKELAAKLDEAVTEAQKQDLMSDEDDEGNRKHPDSVLAGLKPKEIAELWKDDQRWEMNSNREDQRMLCGGCDGDSWSISYTIMEV